MKPNSTTDTTICLPGERSWEVWKQAQGAWQQTQELPPGSGPELAKGASIFGFPIAAAFAVPIRAATTDPDMLPGLIELQLEKQNLKPDTPVGNLLEYRTVEQGENHSLVLAAVLHPQFADNLPRESPARFEITPWLYYLPDNAIVIWRELGRLVFAVTQGDEPVYFQALNAATLTPAAVQEIEHLLMPLYTQGVVSRLESIVLWLEPGDPAADALLQQIFGVPVRHEAHPKPAIPDVVSSLEPVSIANAKIRAAKAARIQRIVALCVGLYLLIPGFFVVKYFLGEKKIKSLTAQVSSLEAAYGHVRPTLETARLMDGAVNFNKYPIELIQQALAPLYESDKNPGVRVTSVDIENGDGAEKKSQITIKGEAANGNHQPAILYQTKVKRNPALQDYKWDYKPQPPKGGIVPFEVRGITRDSNDAE